MTAKPDINVKKASACQQPQQPVFHHTAVEVVDPGLQPPLLFHQNASMTQGAMTMYSVMVLKYAWTDYARLVFLPAAQMKTVMSLLNPVHPRLQILSVYLMKTAAMAYSAMVMRSVSTTDALKALHHAGKMKTAWRICQNAQNLKLFQSYQFHAN
jgi:hypothetical protein